MPYFKDLSPWTRLGDGVAKQLVAIGWINESHIFTPDTVVSEIVEKLEQLPNPTRASIALLGIDKCPFCHETANATSYVIPGNSFLYVYPALLIHYMNKHAYVPPPEFCEAVLNCPALDSTAYLLAVKQNGPRSLFEHIQTDNE